MNSGLNPGNADKWAFHVFHNHKKSLHDTVIIFGLLNVWLVFLNACLYKITELMPFDNRAALFLLAQFMLFCFTLLTLFIPLHKLYLLSKKKISVELPLCFLTVLYLSYYLKVKFDSKTLVMQANEVIFIMVMFFVFYWHRLRYYDKEIKMREDCEKIMRTSMDDLLKRTHKFENVISSINGSLALATDIEEHRKSVKKYIDIVEFDEDMRKILTADNQYIMAFIHSKKRRAREMGKDIITDIAYKKKCQLIPDHIIMVDLLGELLDNAIQNCEEGVPIQVRMQVDEFLMHLEVENKHSWLEDYEIEKLFHKGYSTNNDKLLNHGYGLSNVEDAVKQHQGTIQIVNAYDKDDNKVVIFEVTIMS